MISMTSVAAKSKGYIYIFYFIDYECSCKFRNRNFLQYISNMKFKFYTRGKFFNDVKNNFEDSIYLHIY